MSGNAKVTVGVEGAAEAAKKFRDLQGSMDRFGKGAISAIGGSIQPLIGLSTALTKIDPGQAAERFRGFREEMARLGAVSGTSVDTLKTRFADLSSRVKLPDEQIARFSQSLSKMTYDFGDTTSAIGSLQSYALASGRSLEEMGPIAETLHNAFGASFADMPGMLDQIAGSAEALGTIGGPAALMDQIKDLGGAVSQLSIHGKKDTLEFVGIMAALGKGRTPAQAKRVQQELAAHFAQGGEQMRVNLGIKKEDFYDDNGQIKANAENVKKLRDFYLKRGGGEAGGQRLARFNLGPELTSALFRPGFMEDLQKAESAKPSTRAAGTMEKFSGSEAGGEIGKAITRDRRTREEVGGTTNDVQQKVANSLPESPWAQYAIGALGAVASTARFGVGFVSGKAGSLAKSLVSGLSPTAAGEAGSTAAGAAKTASSAASLAALAGAALFLDPNEEGQTKAVNAANDRTLASGGRREIQHWWGSTYEDAPKQPPVEVKLIIQDDSGHPNKVVTESKGKAGHQ